MRRIKYKKKSVVLPEVKDVRVHKNLFFQFKRMNHFLEIEIYLAHNQDCIVYEMLKIVKFNIEGYLKSCLKNF